MAIKNILAVRSDRFGEFLLNIPAMRALKENFKGSRLTLAVDPYVEGLARALGFVDEVVLWENRRHNWSEILKFSSRIRKDRFDLCVILNPSKDSHLAAFLGGVPVRLGYDRKWGFLLTHKIKDRKTLGEKHEVEYNLDLVSAVGVTTQDTSLRIPLAEAEIARAGEDFKLGASGKIVAIHPWTSDPVKQWPPEFFYSLTKKMLECNGIKIVVIGGKEEAIRAGALFKDMGGQFIDATGKTSLVQLAGLLKNCRLLISCDSGPAHLASCVGTPALVLFRSDLAGKTAKRWGPWGSGNYVIEKSKVTDITPEEVFNKAREALSL